MAFARSMKWVLSFDGSEKYDGKSGMSEECEDLAFVWWESLFYN